jgi:hypothetical protein
VATSEVAICNQALGWIGGSLIISLDDQSVEAKLCKANYAELRDTVLEEREWTFAIKRAEPAKLAMPPAYGFDAAFQLPSDCLRVLQVSRAGSDVLGGGTGRSSTMQGRAQEIEWLREGSAIVANHANQIYIRYISRIVDTTKFSPMFGQALAARIAMDLAIPIAQSAKLQMDMAQMYGEKMQLAASSDGMQGRSYRTRSDSLTVVR